MAVVAVSISEAVNSRTAPFVEASIQACDDRVGQHQTQRRRESHGGEEA